MADEYLYQDDAAEFLRALAATKNVDALAKYCGMDRSNLYKRLNGKLTGLSPQLCDALNIEREVYYILPPNLAEFWERHQNAAHSTEQEGG